MYRLRILTFVACLACLVAARAEQDSDKPSGFDGYLLDSRGLDGGEREASWREDFESHGVSWRYAYQDGQTKITEHKRVADVAHSGRASELIVYEAVEQGVVVFAHYVDYPSVFNETAPSLWALSNRPGVSIAALVVFPKTLRPDSGRPLTALVPGTSYQKPGEWQRLGFPEGLAATLEKTAQALRGEHRLPVNVEGAYVRQIVLVSEARSGSYSLWIDDLEIRERLQPELSSLRAWERGATFEPINLLSARLKLSNTPIFAQSNIEDSDSYGREPFGLDEKKVAENNKIRLEFSKDVAQRSPSSAQSDSLTTRTPSFAESYAILKPDPAEYLAGLTELAPRRAKMLDATNAQSALAMQASPAGVGQASFLGEQGRVAVANFDQIASAQPPASASEPLQVALNRPQDELVVGSGTLESPEDAITETFIKKDDRLVADAQFSGGLLKTSRNEVFTIRAIEYQGEPLEFLKQLGFNAVWLHFAPTARMIYDANKVGIWLIAPPPSGAELVTQAELDAIAANASYVRQTPPQAQMSNLDFGGLPVESVYDCVLLWFLNGDFRRNEVAALQERVTKLRQLDPHRRPTIGSPITGINEYSSDSRLSAILLNRAPILSSLDFNDYGEWLVKYQNLATESRAVFWNTIQTQPEPNSTSQRQFFSLVDESPALVSYEQMRQAVRLSMRAKCRGLLFRSLTSLTNSDHKTQYRAAALEAINLELQLIAPWFAFGNPDSTPLETSARELSAVVSRIKRAILVAPISTASNNQYIMGQDAVNNWSGIVPVREGYSPELLTPGALRKILSKRTAGGCNFTLEEGSMNSTLFFTQSEVFAQKISERAPAYGSRMAKLAINLARKRLDLYEETVYGLQYVEEHGAFPKSAPRSPALADVVSRCAALIDEAELCLRRRDPSQAYLVAERATREIRNTERKFWQEATKAEIARPVTPLSTSFYDMPAYLELYEKLMSGVIKTTGPNLIAGGDMENSQTWYSQGWSIFSEPSSITMGEVFFSADAAKSGAAGIKATVTPVATVDYLPEEVESPVIYVENAFNVEIGSLVCIQGWIKIPEDLQSSVDGVEIYDDQGGQTLALRFKRATDWKHFAFYRRASNNGLMRIRFAFSGIGTVYLDDVAAYVVK